jgi:hypothetical protein
MAGAQVDRLTAVLGKILAIDKTTLKSRPDWGPITFAASEDSIGGIYQIVEILNSLPLEKLPEQAAQPIADALDAAYAVISRNDKFSVVSGNPAAERDSIIQELDNHRIYIYTVAQQWIPFLAYLKGDIPQQLSQISSQVEIAKVRAADFDTWLADRKKEFDQIILATRQASAEAGVGVFTEDFLQEGVARDADAKAWLMYSAGMAAVTLAVSIVFFFIVPPAITAHLIQYVTSKLVILTVLIAGTAWCAGIYKANKHLAAVSRHKGHSLKTFQAFVQATDNKQVQDAVLLETTRAIFANPQTGYLRGEAPAESGSRIVEVIRGATTAAEHAP